MTDPAKAALFLIRTRRLGFHLSRGSGTWVTYDERHEERSPSTEAEVALWLTLQQAWKELDGCREELLKKRAGS